MIIITIMVIIIVIITITPCSHVLILVVVGELVHVLHDLVDAHPEEVPDGEEHPASHLAEGLPCPATKNEFTRCFDIP